MKGLTLIAIVALGAGLLAFPAPAAADDSFAQGDAGSRINLLANCGNAIEYPANTAFFVRHGWVSEGWSTVGPAERRGLMAPSTTFEFRVDFEPQPSAMHVTYAEEDDLFFKTFVSEYHDGMTGTHRFGGLWFLDGSLVGGAFGESVFVNGCVVTVTFV